jgi:hypothetical protein
MLKPTSNLKKQLAILLLSMGLLGLNSCVERESSEAKITQRTLVGRVKPLFHVNVEAIKESQAKNRCPLMEVVPGTWVAVQCDHPTKLNQEVATPTEISSTLSSLPYVFPSAVDLRERNLVGPIKDQGSTGTCTAMSLTSAMENAIRLREHDAVELSALHVWAKYGSPYVFSAAHAALNEKIALEKTWPYDPVKACLLIQTPNHPCGTAYGVEPGSGINNRKLQTEWIKANKYGKFRLVGIEKLSTTTVGEGSALRSVIARGRAVWTSFWIDDHSWKNSSLNRNTVPLYRSAKKRSHVVLLIGYRTKSSGEIQYLIQNSWGNDWGDRGFAWISERNVHRNVRAAFAIRVADANSSERPQAQAVHCPLGTVPDTITGTCSTPCSTGEAPKGSLCVNSLVQPIGMNDSSVHYCPRGQLFDPIDLSCKSLCPNGLPQLGGSCLPFRL